MNLIKNPDLLDRLASAYALGTLRGGARRRFETLAREQAPVRAAALIWQSRIASMNELQPQSEPSPAVWTRIDNLVQAERAALRLCHRSQVLNEAPESDREQHQEDEDRGRMGAGAVEGLVPPFHQGSGNDQEGDAGESGDRGFER